MSASAAQRRKRDYVERELRGIARRARVEWFGVGLFLAIGGVVLLLVAAAVLDWWLILDAAVRSAVRWMLVGLVGVGLGAALVVALRRTRLGGLTRRLERERPEFQDSLLTYVSMRRGHRLAPGQRQALRAVGKRAARILARVDPEDVAPRRAFVMAGGLLAGTLGLFLLLCLAFWTPFVTSVRRVLAPGAGVPPATATRIDRLVVEPACGPAAAVIPQGHAPRALWDSSCRIVARLGGEVPRRAVLFWRPVADDASWRSAASGPGEDGATWRWELATGRRELRFFLAAGDVRSERHSLRLLEPPGVRAIRVQHQPPEYTGRGPRVEEGGDVTALVGTRITITASTTHPVPARTEVPCPRLKEAVGRSVHRPVLRYGDRLVPMEARGTALTASLTVAEAARYCVHFPTREGFWNPDPAWHTVRPLADQPPSVAIVAPPSGKRVPLNQPLPVRLRATDDVGLDRLELLIRRGSDPPRPIALPLDPRQRTVDRVRRLDLAERGWEPGQTLELRARAFDGNPAGPGRSDAAPVVVTLMPAAPPPGEP